MAVKLYGAYSLTGGGTGALDKINGSILNDNDLAMVFHATDNRLYIYRLDADSGAAEDTPIIIKPDTTAGNKRWIQINYLNKTDATVAPTVNDDTDVGYDPGSLWVDVTNDNVYICIDATNGAAIWQGVGDGMHFHDGDTLQADGINSDGGAFSFTTSGLVTFSQAVTSNGNILAGQGSNGVGLYASGGANAGIASTAANSPITVASLGTGDIYLKTGGTAGTTRFTVEDTGNCVVAADLEVNGTNIGITADKDLIAMANGALTVNGDLRVDGNQIGITADTDLMTLGSDQVTINGNLTLADGTTRILKLGGASAGSEGGELQILGATGKNDWTFDSYDDYMRLRVGGTLAYDFYTTHLKVLGDLRVDGGDIGLTADTNLIQIAANAVTVNGTLTATGVVTGASHSKFGNTDIHSDRVDVNIHGSGNRYAYIDLYGDDTYTDYGLRLIRNNSGANTQSHLVHRGTGDLAIRTVEAAAMIFKTTDTERFKITSAGVCDCAGNLLVNGGNIGIDADTDIIQIASGAVTINGTLGLSAGTTINELSTDGTLAGNSDNACPTEKAVKTYVDGKVSGVVCYTGTYTGDGTVSQGITGVGFQPKFVIIWYTPAVDAGPDATYIYMKTNQMGIYALTAGGSYVRDNRVPSLDADGFTVDDDGSNAHPNANTLPYSYYCVNW
jgi:hypothetical protein